MALKTLTLNEMVHGTATLLAKGGAARRVIERSPLLSAVLPSLEVAHAGVVKVVPPSDERAKEIVIEAAAADAVHDALARKIYQYLTCLADFEEPDTKYIPLRDELLPEGVAGTTQITYEGEAGLVERVRSRLTESIQSELKTIPAGKGTLLDVVTEWLDAGDRLGKLERERNALAIARAAIEPSAINEARSQWIRAVHGLRAIAPLAELSTIDDQTVFGPLAELEAKSDVRSARRRGAKIEAIVAEELESDPTAPIAASIAADTAGAEEEDELDTSKVCTDLPGGNPFAES